MSDEIGKTLAADAGDKAGADEEAHDFRGLLRTILFALLIAMTFRTLFYAPFHIPSGSMMPTLLIGDHMFVNQLAYGYSRHSIPFSPPIFEGRIFARKVERGDVVVFKTPKDNTTDFVKRVIGLPGDRIRMLDGVLYLNDTPVKRERVQNFEFEETPYTQCRRFAEYRTLRADQTARCSLPQYRETLPGGATYVTLDLAQAHENDTTREFIVPAGHYFMMGDNRDNSLDSRFSVTRGGVGFVPAENLIGRAEIIFFSTNGEARIWEFWKWFQAMRGERVIRRIGPDG